MIDRILSRPEFTEQPPVLIDVGASGKIHRKWRKFAKYAVCVAFDADNRDFGYVTQESGNYRKLHVFNCIVSDQSSEASDFYLTRSPHCSSLLKPNAEGLKYFAFASLFEVDKIVQLRTVALPDVLRELKLTYVDWFKTDSQGLDLRLFASLPEAIQQQTLVAEFEPGIVDAYVGEDKLHRILAYMEQTGAFWLADFIVKGSPRIAPGALNRLFQSAQMRKLAMFSLKKTAGWGELTYLNHFREHAPFTIRDYLLGWVFATTEAHHGFALQLAERGQQQFADPVFAEMHAYSARQIKSNVAKMKFLPAVRTKLNILLGRE